VASAAAAISPSRVEDATMRVYETTLQALQLVAVDAVFGANENARHQLALKHSSRIKIVAVTAAIADVVRERKPVILCIGFGVTRINDYSAVAPLPRIDREPVQTIQRVYPVVILLAMFCAWGVSHA
jgi:hypothetical protein